MTQGEWILAGLGLASVLLVAGGWAQAWSTGRRSEALAITQAHIARLESELSDLRRRREMLEAERDEQRQHVHELTRHLLRGSVLGGVDVR